MRQFTKQVTHGKMELIRRWWGSSDLKQWLDRPPAAPEERTGRPARRLYFEPSPSSLRSVVGPTDAELKRLERDELSMDYVEPPESGPVLQMTARQGERRINLEGDLAISELEMEHEMAGRMLLEAIGDDSR